MRTAIVLATVSLLAGGCALDAPPYDGELGPHVSVRGESRVEVRPDTLTVRARVTHLAQEIVDATSSVDARTAAALDAARAVGVADDDMRALAISVQPMWDWTEAGRVFRGHEATRMIEVTLRDIELWPDLLAGLINARVDQFDSVEPDHSERDALMRQAMQDAVHDARARADLLAEAAGSRVSVVYSISEQSRGWTQPRQEQDMKMIRTLAAEPAPEAYEPGVILITSEVEAVFMLRGRRVR